ncbi:MAG: hypothetical protein V1672_00600 [Candidatus Diapherotrites archaeon]
MAGPSKRTNLRTAKPKPQRPKDSKINPLYLLDGFRESSFQREELKKQAQTKPAGAFRKKSIELIGLEPDVRRVAKKYHELRLLLLEEILENENVPSDKLAEHLYSVYPILRTEARINEPSISQNMGKNIISKLNRINVRISNLSTPGTEIERRKLIDKINELIPLIKEMH